MKDTIIDSFEEIVTKFPQKEALLFRKGHHFESLTYDQLWSYAQKLAVFLKSQGVGEGDRLALISENRPEWVITDIASMILGTILVPIHSVLAPAQIEMIIDEIEPKIVLVSDKKVFDKVLETGYAKSRAANVIYFEDDAQGTLKGQKAISAFSFKEEVCDKGLVAQIEPIKHKPERIITIIYTSGTTGHFKGVELSNRNIISNIEGVLSMIEITENDKFLSVLPLSHVFERTVGYYIPLLRGSVVSYVEDPTKLSEVAQAEKPTIIIAVPRLYEKVYQAVKDKSGANFAKKTAFNIGLTIGRKYHKKSLPYKIADKIVFGQIKSAFGGRVRFFVSGAASLQTEIGEFFGALDIPVIEGYGLTETSPIISCNTVEKRKYGTVGLILPNIEYKLKGGELFVKGPSVFKSYYNNPEKTKDAFAPGGWFKTGDLVEVSTDGFVKFKAREKEIIALSTGKKVSPAIIEEKLELSPYIAQAFVFGDCQKHVGALLVPDKSRIRGLTKNQLQAKLQEEADLYLNKYVSSYEQIRKFVIISQPMSVENGLMTPTLKLRRNEIQKKYDKQISAIYD
jgi:long-chain acyl-CoA synthetase